MILKSIKGRWLFIALLLSLASIACRPPVAPSNEDAELRLSGPLTGIDHLPEHLSIQQFSVDGQQGSRAGGGGRRLCCIAYPKYWRPDLKVRVRWAVTNWRDRTFYWREESVPVERYDENGGDFLVHFLPDGSARAVVSNLAPGHPDYPGPEFSPTLKNPWEKYADGPLATEVKPHLWGSPP